MLVWVNRVLSFGEKDLSGHLEYSLDHMWPAYRGWQFGHPCLQST